MTASVITQEALAYFGVTKARLTDHSNRDADEMDCRAAIAYALHARLGYSGRRAAKALGYKESTLSTAWNRLRLRVYADPRLRFSIERLWPETRRAA